MQHNQTKNRTKKYKISTFRQKFSSRSFIVPVVAYSVTFNLPKVVIIYTTQFQQKFKFLFTTNVKAFLVTSWYILAVLLQIWKKWVLLLQGLKRHLVKSGASDEADKILLVEILAGMCLAIGFWFCESCSVFWAHYQVPLIAIQQVLPQWHVDEGWWLGKPSLANSAVFF